MLNNLRIIRLKLTFIIYLLIMIPSLISGLLSLFLPVFMWVPIAFLLPIIISYFSPQILKPIFKAGLYNGTFKKRIEKILESFNQKITVYSYKNKNLYGGIALSFGPNKSIYISDKYDSYNEFKAVFLHEVGHHNNLDLLISSTLIPIYLIICGFLTSYQNLSVLNAIIQLIIFSIILFPLVLYFMRNKEKKADKFAYTNDAESWIEFVEKEIRRAEQRGIIIPRAISPIEELFHTHPWIYSRLDAAKKYN